MRTRCSAAAERLSLDPDLLQGEEAQKAFEVSDIHATKRETFDVENPLRKRTVRFRTDRSESPGRGPRGRSGRSFAGARPRAEPRAA